MEFNSITIFGSSGFVGQNLYQDLQESYQVNTVSLRNPHWSKSIPESDVFVNLIGKAHDHKGVSTEEDFYFANVDLTKLIFEAFLLSSAELFIHVSSLAALEELESSRPLKEEDTCNPSSWYGKSKRSAEEWLLEQPLPENKKVVIIRPPMIHGPGDKGNLALLYKLISKGIPYPLASFNNNRSFIGIDNFNFFIKAIINNSKKMESGIYHIADDESISTNEIISVIKKIEKKNTLNLSFPRFIVVGMAKIGDFIPIPLNSIRLKKLTGDLTVSNKKLKSALEINQLPLSAEEGIIKTINSFKNKE